MNLPILRFPEFKGEWELKKLGEVSNVYDGTHQTPNYTNEGIPFYSVEQITANDFNKTKFVSKSVFDKENKRVKIERGDILMTRIGDIGTARFVNWDVNASFYVSIALIKQSLKYNSEFFSHYIGTHMFQNELWNRTIHVAFPKKINLGEISNCIAYFPTISEQQKIATFFTAVDEKLQALKQKKSLLEQYKKGVMQQIFSQELRFKDDNGNAFADWEEKKLGEVSIIKKGKQLNKEELTATGTYLCINGGISPSGYTENFNTLGNTITISEGGNSCGFINFFKCNFWSGGHNYSLEIINPNKNDNDFIFQILKQNQPEIMSLRVGSGLPNIQKKDLVAFTLKLPSSIKEQTKIASFLATIDNKISHCQAQITHTEVWKKGLLQQMFV